MYLSNIYICLRTDYLPFLCLVFLDGLNSSTLLLPFLFASFVGLLTLVLIPPPFFSFAFFCFPSLSSLPLPTAPLFLCHPSSMAQVLSFSSYVCKYSYIRRISTLIVIILVNINRLLSITYSPALVSLSSNHVAITE